MYTCASFFAGVGGIDKGFENAGIFKTIYANEFDPFPVKTYEKNFDLKITRSYEKRVDGKNNYDYYLDNVLELNDEISFFYENYLNCTDIGDGAQFNDNITNINGLYMSLNHIPLYFDFNKIISEDITVTLKFLNHFIRKSLKNDLKNTLIFGLTG